MEEHVVFFLLGDSPMS